MADFDYIAIDKKGKTRSGSISAGDSKNARRKVMQQGLTVLKIKMSGEAKGTSNKDNIAKDKQDKKLSLK